MVATTMATLAAAAQPAAVDTVHSIALSEVEVLGTRASENTPVAFTNITGKQLAAENHGLDIPLLAMVVSFVVAAKCSFVGIFVQVNRSVLAIRLWHRDGDDIHVMETNYLDILVSKKIDADLAAVYRVPESLEQFLR